MPGLKTVLVHIVDGDERVLELGAHLMLVYSVDVVVEIFEGNVRVIFYDSSNSKAVNFPNGIDATPYVISELIALLGKDNVVPK